MKAFFILLLIFTGTMAFAEKQDCKYRISESSSLLTLTAYKFTEKTGVSGTVDDFKWISNQWRSSYAEVGKNLAFEINFKSLKTKDSARDMNIVENFFRVVSRTLKVKGTVSKYSKDKATVVLEAMNKKIEVPVKLSVKGQQVDISGSVNMSSPFFLDAFNSIKKACFELHKGKDGKSVTWPTVDVGVRLEIQKECS